MRPGNRYDRGKTLGELIAAKLVLLAACRRCKHQSLICPPALIERFGENTPAIDIRPMIRCSACCTGGPTCIFNTSRGWGDDLLLPL
jgi:hypothetical protein